MDDLLARGETLAYTVLFTFMIAARKENSISSENKSQKYGTVPECTAVEDKKNKVRDKKKTPLYFKVQYHSCRCVVRSGAYKKIQILKFMFFF